MTLQIRAFCFLMLALCAGCAGAAREAKKTSAKSADAAPVIAKLPEAAVRSIGAMKLRAASPLMSEAPPFVVRDGSYKVPVFFGTNRMAKLTEAMNYRYHFRRFFVLPSVWAFGILMLASWLVPAMIAAAVAKRSSEGAAAPFLAAAVAGFCFVGMWAMKVSPNAFVLAGIGCVSYALFRWLPGIRQPTILRQLALGAACWLLCYSGYAAVAARINSKRDMRDPGSHYGNLLDETLHVGICDVTVPTSYVPGTGVIPRPVRIGQIELPEDPSRHVVLHEVLTLEESEFFARLREDVARPENPEREAFVFIHGYNNTFKGAAYRTALIARDLEFPGPAIFFSWPSRGELEDYPADEEAADYSVPYVRDFIEKVSRHSGARKLHLFAHSMGNRPLTEALQTLLRGEWPEKECVKEVILAAPDIPQQRFRTQLLPDLVGKGPRVTLYASSRDLALATSKAVHKQPRAGQGGPFVVLAPGLDTVDASGIEQPILSLGHNYAFDHPALRRDIRLLMSGESPPRESLERKLRNELTYWLAGSRP